MFRLLGIIQKHDGNLIVNSVPDKGTSFSIFLPQTDKPVIHENVTTDKNVCGSEHVLFVDDEEVLVELTKEFLELMGYVVTAHTSGQKALEEFTQTPNEFDFLITDLTMPGMSGLELIKAVTDVRPDLPVLLCTGYNPWDNDEVIGDGVEYCLKPIGNHDLAKKMRQILDNG